LNFHLQYSLNFYFTAEFLSFSSFFGAFPCFILELSLPLLIIFVKCHLEINRHESSTYFYMNMKTPRCINNHIGIQCFSDQQDKIVVCATGQDCFLGKPKLSPVGEVVGSLAEKIRRT
jgi:hypothetical protein